MAFAIFAFKTRASATSALRALGTAPDLFDFEPDLRFDFALPLPLRVDLRLDPLRLLELDRERELELEPVRVPEAEAARLPEPALRLARRLEDVVFLVAMVAPWSRVRADGSAQNCFYLW